ncbi:MAG: hypothetical protein ACRDO2_00300, partial [Nocardioidaceae bacterium]
MPRLVSRPPAFFVLAWGLWSCWVASVVATFWLGGGLSGDVSYLLMLALVGYATVGALVASRQPGNAVGWLLLATALALAVSAFGNSYVVAGANPGYVAVAWLSSWLGNAALAIVLVFLPLCFPNGRLPSPRWRPVWWFALVATIAWILAQVLAPGRLTLTGVYIENPLGVQGTAERVLEVVGRALPVAGVACLLLSLASLLVRFSRSRGAERQQLKWFTYAVLLPLPGLALTVIGDWLLPDEAGEIVNGIGWTAFVIAFAFGIPAAT